MLGQSNKDGIRKTDKSIRLKLKPGNMETYDACAAGNDRQKKSQVK